MSNQAAVKSTTGFVSMPMVEYRAAEGISKSSLDLVHRSPAHYKHVLDNPEPPTPAMVFGSMFHKFVLEPDTFFDEYAVIPMGMERRSKEGKQAWADWQSANEGKEGVEVLAYGKLEAMRDALFANSRVKALLTGGQSEQCAFWTSRRPTGPDVLCKSRFDYVVRGYVVDLKTTGDARPDEFARSCWNYRYHVQSAMYSDAYRELMSEKPKGFILIPVEKEPPHAPAIYTVADEMMEQGRHEYYTDLNVYAECLGRDEWPGYPEIVQELMLPVWAQEGRY